MLPAVSRNDNTITAQSPRTHSAVTYGIIDLLYTSKGKKIKTQVQLLFEIYPFRERVLPSKSKKLKEVKRETALDTSFFITQVKSYHMCINTTPFYLHKLVLLLNMLMLLWSSSITACTEENSGAPAKTL